MKWFNRSAKEERAAEPGLQAPDGIDLRELTRQLLQDGNRAAERHVNANPAA